MGPLFDAALHRKRGCAPEPTVRLRTPPAVPLVLLFLLVDTLQTIVLSLVHSHTLYARIYFGTEPLIWFFYYMVLFELFGLVVRDYPGIAAFRSRVMPVLLAAAIGISILTLLPGLKSSASPYPILKIFTVVQRTVIISVLLFLFLIQSFLFRWPVHHSRNTVAYAFGYMVLFAGKAFGLLLITAVGVHLTRAANVAILTLSCFCLLFWCFTLNRAGDTKQTTLAEHWKWKPGERDRLRDQIRAINSLLFRLIRK